MGLQKEAISASSSSLGLLQQEQGLRVHHSPHSGLAVLLAPQSPGFQQPRSRQSRSAPPASSSLLSAQELQETLRVPVSSLHAWSLTRRLGFLQAAPSLIVSGVMGGMCVFLVDGTKMMRCVTMAGGGGLFCSYDPVCVCQEALRTQQDTGPGEGREGQDMAKRTLGGYKWGSISQ